MDPEFDYSMGYTGTLCINQQNPNEQIIAVMIIITQIK